jgi:periplasmic protein TonB
MKSATAWQDSRSLHFALGGAASILLHLPLLLALQPALPPQEERFSQQAIEVTLERAMAPPAAPAPPAMAEAGQARPSGSIDLVHTALAPGPADFAQPLQRPLSESPAALPLSSAWQPAEAALVNAVMLQEQPPVTSEPAAGAPSAAVRAPDALDRVQAPPTAQPQRQAARQAGQPTPASPSATSPGTGAPDRRTDTASHASQRDAQQDYVMQVVRKLSQAQFSTEAEPRRSPRGALIASLTVDRDGNLVGLSLAKDSGSASVDRSILEKVRKMAPFAPLPKVLAVSRFSFIVPITYAQEP